MEEKRTNIRINQLHLIHYECYDPQHHVTQQGMGRTLDISESGLQLELAGDFELDQEVKFTLGVGDDLVELTGRVVRQDPGTGKGAASLYGIQLFDIRGGGRDRLTNYIQRVRTAPADRRRQVRIDMRYLLGYEFRDSRDEVDRSGMGRTLNLSVEGIVFESFHSLQIGQEVALTLALDENALAELKGEVMHLRQMADSRYRVGIRFTTIHPTVQRILKYLISKQRRSDAGSL